MASVPAAPAINPFPIAPANSANQKPGRLLYFFILSMQFFIYKLQNVIALMLITVCFILLLSSFDAQKKPEPQRYKDNANEKCHRDHSINF
jgi:hypothetical protein